MDDRVCPSPGIVRIQQHARLSHNFGNRGGSRGKHRRSARHGLHEREPEAFVSRRINKRSGAAVERAQRRFRDRPKSHDRVGHTTVGSSGRESIANAAIDACKYQGRWLRLESPACLDQSADHHREISPLVQIADVQQKRRDDSRRQRRGDRTTLVEDRRGTQRRHGDAIVSDIVGGRNLAA